MSRLSEKLAAAAGVVPRQHAKIEARADAIIAREADIERLSDQAFTPHEAMLDEAQTGLASLEQELAVLSNDPHSGALATSAGASTGTRPPDVKLIRS